ncbi:MAG: general secretion pathway protein GspB [Desulfobulbaceae bacterium]|nr:general secretion pathway protein GspB [Desulfobulbaceae bacterium]
MSYILDALKKSDRERKKGTTPTIYSVHSNQVHPKMHRSKPGRLPLLLLATLLIIGGGSVATYFFYFANKSKPNTDISINGDTTTADQRPQATIGLQSEPIKVISPITIKPAALLNKKLETDKQQDKVGQRRHLEQPNPTQSQKTDITQLQNLPESIKSELPVLAFAGHTYSETPSQRMIIINNEIVKEGERIEEELRLIEITWEGIVLEFKDHLFSMKTQ